MNEKETFQPRDLTIGRGGGDRREEKKEEGRRGEQTTTMKIAIVLRCHIPVVYYHVAHLIIPLKRQ